MAVFIKKVFMKRLDLDRGLYIGSEGAWEVLAGDQHGKTGEANRGWGRNSTRSSRSPSWNSIRSARTLDWLSLVGGLTMNPFSLWGKQ